jgi:hypothetical protein
MRRIGLKETIGELRAELSDSILAAGNEKLRFEVGTINLEFQVEVEHAAEGSSEIKFWVVELGAKGTHTSTKTHTVRIELKPISQGGGPVLTGITGEIPE